MLNELFFLFFKKHQLLENAYFFDYFEEFNIFSDKKRVQKILDAKSTEEIFNVFINSVDN